MNFPVTVIIPCHNAQRWLASTLTTVAGQTHKPDAVILVADRCSDDSIQIAGDFPLEIQIIETDFGNAGPARNAGIHAATTPWIALLDADDHWYPTHLANAAGLLADSEHVAYCARYDLMDNQNQRLDKPVVFPAALDQSRVNLTDEDYVQFMSRHMPFGHSAVIYHRDRFNEVGGFDAGFVRRHDIHLWLRMIYQHKWAFHNEAGVLYRHQTPGAISRNRVEVVFYETLAMIDNLSRYHSPVFNSIVQDYARLAMSVGFHDADPIWAGKLRELAMPHLTGKYKMSYKIMGICPPVFKMLISLKRRTFGRLLTALRHARQRKTAEHQHLRESE